ncbi:MAG: GntR family transcriptional regulator [Novibacillus thermophilus]|jgi:hypothetical protein|uniref:Transcriptional regulator n=1 Tax=Novibacillus thermophilus TaxID=1471761 RepID=A0A1U9K8J8_9BACL|nr:GntR family transcriptional regulator YhfZ [Novibacillus thermophilus]AQS56362.1 transcriptional regulator [Novibacillus thermophilus]
MASISDRLYTKNGLAARKIAGRLLSVKPGERIPRVSDFASELSLGRGTVQGALRLLEDMGAIDLEARGHLGTFLKSKDDHALWEIAGMSQLVGVMPLPYSRKYEGLATGLLEAFHDLDVPFNLAFMRGSKHRLDALKSGRYDFAVISGLAGELAEDQMEDLHVVKRLGPYSYVSGHEIFFADASETAIRDGMRVGIDYSSADQYMLTSYECRGLAVEFVEVNYMQLIDMLRERKIDAAVWNKDEFRHADLLGRAPFQSERAQKLSQKVSEAVLVAESENNEVVKQRLADLSVDKVRRVQQKVEEGRMFARY